MRRNLLLGALLLLLGGTVTGLVLVLSHSAGSTAPSALTEVAATPTPTPSATPSPTASPPPSPTPRPTASATATTTTASRTSPTTVATTAAPKPLPRPTPTSGTEGVTVTVDGPTTVVVGQEYAFTMRVTWTHERPASIQLDFDRQQLPRTDGCHRPTTPPAHIGPGSTTITATHTWTTTNGAHAAIGTAVTGCQYYEGGGQAQRPVTVTAAPSPQPS